MIEKGYSMATQRSDGKFTYHDYEVDAMGEPEVVPFDRLIRYVNDHPGSQFFIFAKRCTEDDVDSWYNNDHVTVHWRKDMTPTPGTDPLSIFVQSFDPVKPNFGGILEISSSISAKELYSLYNSEDNRPVGELIIARDSYLPKNITEYYEDTFKSGFKLEDREPYLNALFRGWALLQYAKHFNEDIGPPHRPEYLLLYSDGDLDGSFIDWGEVIGVHSIEF
jgi:hypothetical protein